MSDRELQHELNDELLSAYIDDELTPEERAAVEARLASDPDAQQLLHQLRSVSQSVQALPQMPAGRDLRDDILRRVESRKPTTTAVRDGAAKGLASRISNDTIFQSRRPWIWATLALAAGLMIMVVQWNNESADKLREVAQNTSSANVDRKLGESRRAADTTAPAASSVATKTESEESRVQPLASSTPMPAELALAGKSSADKLSTALPDMPAAAPPVPESKPTASATAALDELNRADRFAAANSPSPTSGAATAGAPLAAAEPQDAAAVSANEGPGTGAFGGANFKGGRASRSPSTNIALSPQSPSPPPAAGPAAPMSERQSESDDAKNSLVVVHIVAKQNAIENKSFDALLKSKGINVEPEQMREASGRAGGVAASDGNRPAVEGEIIVGHAATSADAEADVVLVEAPKSTIVEFLSELKDDVTNYSSIAVDEPPLSQDFSAVNGNLKKELATDLGAFNRGIATQKLKDDATSRYFYDAGRDRAKATAPRGGISSGKNIRLEETKQLRRESLEALATGRARRLSSLEINQPRLEQSADRGRAAGLADAEKSVLRRSSSGAKAPAGGESDQLQVLFVLSPEHAAASSAPAAKPAE